MTIYIKIPITPEAGFTQEDFAADYLATTGEIFVLNNMQEEKAEDQMTGSGRITEAHAIELQGNWPMMKYYVGYPAKSEWTAKVAAE